MDDQIVTWVAALSPLVLFASMAVLALLYRAMVRPNIKPMWLSPK